MPRQKFNAAYYQRFYDAPKTRAASPYDAKREAAFISAYLRKLHIMPARILDIGCGLGWLLRALGREFPRARLQGVEFSEHACNKFGWIQGSVVDYQDKPYDLVMCNDVLAYLDDKNCALALKNLATLSKSALFLGVPTVEDRKIWDRQRTDLQQHLRPDKWYRHKLKRSFANLGGGLYLKKPLDTPVWSLDKIN